MILNDMKLKQKYVGDQGPAERLRNKLSPFFTLAQVIVKEPDVLVDGPFKQQVLEMAQQCGQFFTEVREHIDDAGTIEDEYVRMRQLEEKRNERKRREHLDATGEELDDFELMEDNIIDMMELNREEEERPTGFLGIVKGEAWFDDEQKRTGG